MTVPPIPSVEVQKFLAHEGVVQWAEAVCMVRDRLVQLEAARQAAAPALPPDSALLRSLNAAIRSEHDFFANAAAKLMAYRVWASELGAFDTIDFSVIDAFNQRDITDLRNMREHITEYFGRINQKKKPGGRPGHEDKSGGRDRDRWVKVMADGSGDASTSAGTLIGNRLDYVAFTAAVAAILPDLKRAPIPQPPTPGMS